MPYIKQAGEESGVAACRLREAAVLISNLAWAAGWQGRSDARRCTAPKRRRRARPCAHGRSLSARRRGVLAGERRCAARRPPTPGGAEGRGGRASPQIGGGEARASLSAWARLCCGVDVWGQIDEQRHSHKACPSYVCRMDKSLSPYGHERLARPIFVGWTNLYCYLHER